MASTLLLHEKAKPFGVGLNYWGGLLEHLRSIIFFSWNELPRKWKMISCQEMEDKGFICPCNKSIHRRDYGILSFMWFFPLHFNTQTHKTQRNKVTLTFCYGVVKQRNHCVFTQTQLLSGKHKRGSRWQQQGARWALSHSSSRITRAQAHIRSLLCFVTSSAAGDAL